MFSSVFSELVLECAVLVAQTEVTHGLDVDHGPQVE